MSKRKDYYKILGIDKSSSEQQIKKAYRKLALKLHPDKEPDPEKKGSSEKKFKEVADAYEVLMDPEKKARFDNGEDLNEPQQQVGASCALVVRGLTRAAAESLRWVRRRWLHVPFRVNVRWLHLHIFIITCAVNSVLSRCAAIAVVFVSARCRPHLQQCTYSSPAVSDGFLLLKRLKKM
jgi:hypothetical protein